MLNALFSKVYNGVLTFSILFFSNYIGNSPRLSDIHVELSDTGLYLSCFLIDAFENDFDEIFDSGIKMSVIYEVEVTHNKNTIYRKDFENSVTWDFEYRQWIVHFEEENVTLYIENIEQLKRTLSFLETFIYFDSPHLLADGISREYDKVEVKISVRLPFIYVPSIEKNMDLMVLWRLTEPTARINVYLEENR